MNSHALVGAAALALSLALEARTTQSQTVATDALRLRGTDAYNRLPANVTLRDAPLFSEALRNLYAYEQRALREGDRRVHAGAEAALDWLSLRIVNMKTGKGDQLRNDADLRDRGLEMYEKARKSEQAHVIWDVTSYLSASANLFAYSQIVSDPGNKVRAASRWLENARVRLAKSGVGAADTPIADPETWLPSRPRPSLDNRPGATAGAREEVASGRVGDRTQRASERATAPASSDSVPPMPSPRNQATLDLAKLYMSGNLREARALARGRLDADPNDGDIHMALALIYAKASGSRATAEDRAVLWLALDHLNIAIKTGAISEEIGQMMRRDLEAQSPTADDLKIRGWIVGQRLRVNFAPFEWIDEETTIRLR